jgi:hypothetical protein
MVTIVRKAWLDAELCAVRLAYEAGDTDEEIGASLGRSGASVSNVRQAYGITRPAETLKRAPLWGDEDLAKARRMYAEGWPNEAIAEAVGRTRVAIKRLVTNYDLTRDAGLVPSPSVFDRDFERHIPAFVAGYAVSSFGFIISMLPGHLGNAVNPWTDKDGYQHVTLRKDGADKRFAVHVIVCTAFHGPRPSDRHQAAHNDGDPGNNRVSNLRWATPKENQADRRRHGTAERGDGGRFIKCRGTADMVRKARAAGIPIQAIPTPPTAALGDKA